MSKKGSALTCLGIAVVSMLVVVGVVLGLVVYLAVLPRQRYDDADARAALEDGEALMRTWLAEHEPEATLGACENVVFSYPSGPSYLSDYVRGSYEQDGATRSFVINGVSGEVYLSISEEALAAALPSYVCETLGLPESTEYVTVGARLLVPFAVEGSTRTCSRDTLDLGCMVPAGVTDISAWLRTRAQGHTLSLNVYAHPGNDFNLSELTFERLLDVRASEGLAYDALYLTTETQTLDVLHDHYFYEHFASGDCGPFIVWYRDAYLEQEVDSKGSLSVVGRAQVELGNDLVIAQVDDGFEIRVTGSDTTFPYFLSAPSGSELVERAFRWMVQDAETQLLWKAQQDGTWCLSTEDGLPFRFYGSGELLSNR